MKKTSIKIISNLKIARILNLPLNEFITILKFNLPMYISVIESTDVTGVRKLEYQTILEIVERVTINNIQQVVYNDKKNKENALTGNYNIFIDLYSKAVKDPNLDIVVEIPIDVYKQKRTLFSYRNLIKEGIIENCEYIDLYKDGETIEIRFKSDDKGSNVSYYFDNATLLTFTNDGPILITDSVEINNFVDIVS